jgi:hypothetical protein
MADDSRSSSGILATRSSGDEIDFVEENSLDDMPSTTLSGRGALIGGLPVSSTGGSSSSSFHNQQSDESPPPASSSSDDDDDDNSNKDLESALVPPDIPPLLFPSFRNNYSNSHHHFSRRGTSQRVPLDDPAVAAATASPPPVAGSRRRQAATEGPVGPPRPGRASRGANDSSTWSESEPGWDAKFKKPSVWYSLACVSVLLIGVRRDNLRYDDQLR